MASGFKIASAYVDVEIDQAALDASIADVEAKLQAIKDRSVGVGINQADLDASILEVQAKLQAIKDRSINATINQAEFDASIAEVVAKIKAIQDAFNIRIDTEGLGVALVDVAAMDQGTRDMLSNFKDMRTIAAELAGVALAGHLFQGGWQQNWVTWAHWILAAGAELSAVVVPAAVAMGAAIAVAAQGAQMAWQHMDALYDATEATYNMLGESAGAALGLRSELQQAQNAANPMVYQAMGGFIEIAKDSTLNLAAAGEKVLQVFDAFIAKIQVDLSSGGSNLVGGLLSDMEKDLIEIAAIFGNLGSAIVHFAGDMPGLVHVLLAGVLAVSEFIKWISELPHWLVEGAFALEEAYRWGGLFATVLARMSSGISTGLMGGVPLIGRFGEIFQTMVKSVSLLIGTMILRIGQGVSSLGFLGSAGSKAGSAIQDAGVSVGEFGENIGPGMAAAVVIGAAALGFLIYKILTAKSAAQEYVSSLQEMATAVPNVSLMSTLVDALSSNTTKLAQAEQTQSVALKESRGDLTRWGEQLSASGVALNNADIAIGKYTSGNQYLISTLTTLGRNINYLTTTYGTTYIGSLELAQEANVNLTTSLKGNSEASDEARLKIADLVAGYEAMGVQSGLVGRDMTALAIDAGEQTTKVSGLNTAWDDWMQTITGGTSSLAALETSITNLTSGTNNISTILGSSSVSLSLKQFAADLRSSAGDSATAWTNFDQVIGSTAPAVIDWLREAGSEGELSGGQFTQAVKDMVAQLLPFASDSKTATAELDALAQQAGGPTTDSVSALTAWVGKSGNATQNLQDIIDTTTQKMGNMAQVAQNLGNVMATDIIQQMDNAKLSVDNVNQATQTYTESLQKNGSQSSTTHTDYRNLVQILTNLTGNNKEANTIAQTYARSLGDDNEKTVTLTTNTNKLAKSLIDLPTHEKPTINVTATGSWEFIAGSGTGHLLHAAKGMLVPGYGGGDRFPILVEGGEAVVPKEVTPFIADILKKYGIPGFQGGGSVDSSYAGTPQGAGSWASTEYQATVNAAATDTANAVQSMLAAAAGASATSGQVISWLLQALKDTKTSTSWLSGLEIIASHESSDNPDAINLTDVNAAAGDPSRGLMQVIMSTFDAYHQAGTSWNIFNPVANAAAAINYIKSRYGSVWNVPGVIAVEQGRPYVGYGNGGYIPPGQIGMVGERGPESVYAGASGATVTPTGGGKQIVVNQNFYGPQYPTTQQRQQMRMDLTLALGVAP